MISGYYWVINNSKTVTWADDPENIYKRADVSGASPIYEAVTSPEHQDSNIQEHQYVDDVGRSPSDTNIPAQHQSDYMAADNRHTVESNDEYQLNDTMDQQLYANQQYYYTDDGQYVQPQTETYEQYEPEPLATHSDYQDHQQVCEINQ